MLHRVCLHIDIYVKYACICCRTIAPDELEIKPTVAAPRNFAEGFWDHLDRVYDKIKDSIAATHTMVSAN